MRNMTLSLITSVLSSFPVSADPEKGHVLTAKVTPDNMEVRLIAAKIDNTRGGFLHAKFVPLKGEGKEIEVRFPGHTFTTHETTIMQIIYSGTGVREFHRKPHTRNIKDAGKDTEWSEASINVVFSIPKDLRATWNDYSHWYLVSMKIRDKK
jgi:hypothetical protein